MTSSAKRRKAKKKKQAGGHAQNQPQGSREDQSGIEHSHEEDEIIAQTPAQTKEGQGEDGSSEGEEGGSPHSEEEKHIQVSSTGESPAEGADAGFSVPGNGGERGNENGGGKETEAGVWERGNENGGGKETVAGVSSGGASEEKDGPLQDLGPLTGTEEGHHPRESLSRTSSSSISVGDREEVPQGEVETRTDVVVIAFGSQSGGRDESEVSSSKGVGSEESEAIQTVGPLTDVHELSSKDETHVDEVPSEELESSDGDESKLDVVSTMAVLDANESIQSVGSAESPRSPHSISSQVDQTSNDGDVLIYQEQDRWSEGISVPPYQDLSNKNNFLKGEPADMEAIDLPRAEDGQEGLGESMKGSENEENTQVSTEVVSDNYSILREQSIESVVNLDKAQVSFVISSGTAGEENKAIPEFDENFAKSEEIPIVAENFAKSEEIPIVAENFAKSEAIPRVDENFAKSEAIPKTDENTTKPVDVPLLKSESNNIKDKHVISTGGEGERAISCGEATGDVASSNGRVNKNVISTGGEASGENMGLSKVEGISTESKEISNEEIASHPQNGANEKTTLLQRDRRTSWLGCCGLVELLRGAQS